MRKRRVYIDVTHTVDDDNWVAKSHDIHCLVVESQGFLAFLS